MTIDLKQVKQAVNQAIAEDLGPGCLSTTILPNNEFVSAKIISREAGVLCGRDWVEQCFLAVDQNIRFNWQAEDGDNISENQVLLELSGPIKALLIAERTALNFLQTLSGTATVTRLYVEGLSGFDCKILDTRKTIPGLRYAQKYATFIGGATNHRMGLYDAFLIKENHLKAFGSLREAIKAARNHKADGFVEVEVETLPQLKEALEERPNRIMLDNFSIDEMVEAVQLNQGYKVPLEASGNVSLNTLQAVARTGVNYISVGAITKHLKALDLSLLT